MDNVAEAEMSVAADRVTEARSGPADSLGHRNLDFAKGLVNRGEDYQSAANDQLVSLPELRARLKKPRKGLRTELGLPEIRA